MVLYMFFVTFGVNNVKIIDFFSIFVVFFPNKERNEYLFYPKECNIKKRYIIKTFTYYHFFFPLFQCSGF